MNVNRLRYRQRYPLVQSRWPQYGRCLTVLGGLLLLVACDWVDSTGRQEDAPVITLERDNVVPLSEQVPLNLDVRTSLDPEGKLQNWRWSDTPLVAGDLPDCNQAAGFERDYIASSLTEACADAAACEFGLTENPQTGLFFLSPPELRAPVGLTYRLAAEDEASQQITYDYTFCVAAINEAPDAINDAYSVTSGTPLTVAAGNGLLANDSDDVDASNQPLRLLRETLTEPLFAAEFAVQDDGSFTYLAINDHFGDDTFTYAITDGLQTSTASVTVTTLAVNLAPVVATVLPDINTIAGIASVTELGEFVTDPEGSALSFRAADGQLPEALALSSDGGLSGAVERNQAARYPIDVVASDGTNEVEFEVAVAVALNRRPLVTAIDEIEALSDTAIEVELGSFFSDPEQQPLVFTLTDDDDSGLEIDADDGLLTGVVDDAGSYELRVSASDGFTVARIATVELDVEARPNRAPVYTGSIPSLTVVAGVPITPVVAQFSDPDGDALTFRTTAPLPAGLRLTSAGGIVGTPTTPGRSTNMRIIATDTEGDSVRSDLFRFTVEAAPNSAPEVELPASLTFDVNRELEFEIVGTDVDADELSYELTGTLSFFLDIDADTGVVTGVLPVAGRYSGTVTVSDGDAATSVNFSVLATL